MPTGEQSGQQCNCFSGLIVFLLNRCSDGTLVRSELHDFITQRLKLPYTEYQSGVVFRFFDDDNGGAISAGEIVHVSPRCLISRCAHRLPNSLENLLLACALRIWTGH